MLHIEIWYTGLDRSDALDNHVREQVGHELKRFSERLTRVEAYLSDENAGKGGPNDRRCVLEARPRGMEPIVVRDAGDDIFLVVRNTARKLERALSHKFEKADAV